MTLEIQTERLILRPYQQSDAPQLRRLANDFDIAKMVASFPYPYPDGLAERWIGTHDDLRARDAGYPLAIEKNGELLGSIGIERCEGGDSELNYWLGKAAWGQGIGSEAARAVLAFAFDELKLSYVRARHIADNLASARVLAKMGFLGTGRNRDFHAVRQEQVEMIHVILLRDAFIRDDSTVKQVYKAA